MGLWDLINSKGGLDARMHDGLLSHGQRQLFCLARALLHSSSIVIMEEVTSSASQELIFRIIAEDLHAATVITIAHKLEQMGNYDRIIVLASGQIVEQGSSQDLLGRDSIFRSLFMQQRGGGYAIGCPSSSSTYIIPRQTAKRVSNQSAVNSSIDCS